VLDRPRPRTLLRDRDLLDQDVVPDLPRILRFRVLGGLSLVVAAASLLLFRTPTFDVWAWLLWGREAAHLQLSTTWGPSFKPLPVAFATLVSPLGGAAPVLWLLVARVGGLLAVGAAARLAYRIAGPSAAAVAAVGVLTTHQYVGYLLPQGMSEPLMVAFLLWAIDRVLDDRRETAFWLGVCAGLLRPEIWPFLLGYAIVLGRNRPGWPGRGRLLAGLVALPVAWYLPDYLGSGQPFRQGEGVPVAGGPLTQASPALAVFRQVQGDLPSFVLVGAVLGIALAVWTRHRLLLGVTGFGLAWIVTVALMAQAGRSTGVSRYVLPTYAVIAVLSGVGWMWFAAWVRRRIAGRAGSPVLLAGAAVLGAAAVAGSSAMTWLGQFSTEVEALRYQQGLERALPAAIDAAGGADTVLDCGRTWTSMYQVTYVAWTLHERIEDVWSLQSPGLDESAYVGPLLQTQDRRDTPVAPAPFTFLQYRLGGTAEHGGATWSIQLPADCS
jgi:hypothetical protein